MQAAFESYTSGIAKSDSVWGVPLDQGKVVFSELHQRKLCLVSLVVVTWEGWICLIACIEQI